MGKGDVKSRKGKIWRGSYGKTRRRKKKKAIAKSAEVPNKEKRTKKTK